MNRTLHLLIATAALAGCAFAQATATLRVEVADSSGGVIPQARVSLTDIARGIEKIATSDTGGVAVFPLLDPGNYAITVKLDGFTTFRQTGIVLEVGQVATVNIALTPGSVQETVNVSANVAQIETNTAAVSSMIDRRTVDQLPLNGRNPYQLAQLNASVTTTPGSRGANPNLASAVAFSVAGGRALTNQVLVDGVDINGRADNWPAFKPSPDAVQEFRILTNAYSAEYGRSGGGTLTFTTRSGTNNYRGTVWEFFRNDALDATAFFSNRQGTGKEKLRYNQFGGNFGGPILRNKLFFFANFEMLKTSTSNLLQSTVPTLRQRRGDFSELPNLIYQPGAGTRVPFAQNQIPAQLQDRVAQRVVASYPEPNRPGLLNNYAINSPTTSLDRQFIGRIDYAINERHQTYFRISRNWDDIDASGTYPGNVATTTTNGLQKNRPWSVVADYVFTINPRTVAHATAGASRSELNRTQPSEGFDPTSLGFPSYIATATGEGNVFPSFSATGYSPLGPLLNFGITETYQNNYSAGGDLSMNRGSHNIKLGGSYRVYQVNNFRADDPAGNFSFTRSFTARTAADTASGDAIASMLLGIPAGGRIGIAPRLAASNHNFGIYIQDDWNITRKLTINLGLRYESDLPTIERFNRTTNFATLAPFPANPGVILAPQTIGGVNVPGRNGPLTGAVQFVGRGNSDTRYLSDPDLNNLAPRVGIAYKLNDKTVIRTGAGIFYAPMVGGGITAGTLAMVTESQATTYLASLDNGVTPNPGASLSNPFPNGILPVPGDSLGALTSYGLATLPTRLRALRNPKSAQWNFNVQRQLPGSLITEIAYVGSTGIGLLGGTTDLNQISDEVRALGATALNTRVANPFLTLPVAQRPPAGGVLATPTLTVAQLLRPYPQFGAIQNFFANDAHSSYHSAQIKIERRFSSGFNFQTSYSFSKLIDDISAIQAAATVQIPNYQDMNNRHLDKSLSTFDSRHRFVTSALWALPFGKGRPFANNNRKLDWIAGGWNLNAIFSFQGGFPLAISTAATVTPGLGYRALRPNIVGDPTTTAETKQDRIARWFNTAAFQPPALFQIGNAGRTIPNLRGPNHVNLDLALHKNFQFTERIRTQLRLEAFNSLNRANFGLPGTVLGGQGFGVIDSTGDPRNLQIAVKIYF